MKLFLLQSEDVKVSLKQGLLRLAEIVIMSEIDKINQETQV